MIFRCEVWNSYAGNGKWVETEIVGDDFLTEFRRRFGHLRFRNVKMLQPLTGDWVDLEVAADA